MMSNAKSGKRSALAVACAIGSMSLFALTPADAAETYHGIAVSPAPEALHAWHEGLKAFPPMEEGCFHASYPSLVWERESCLPPPASESITPIRRSTNGASGTVNAVAAANADGVESNSGESPETAGSGYDYIAETSGLTTSVTGSFPTVTGVTSASTGSYTLQLNTNMSNGPSALCKGYGYGTKTCRTWQQFIYASTGEYTVPGPAQAYIQNWLFPLPSKCPSGWTRSVQGGGCFKNSSAVTVDTVALTDLANAKLTGAASVSGNDSVTFYHGTTAKAVNQSGSTLDIGSTWNASEFNVVGNGGGSGLTFNSGSSLTVRIQANDGTSNAPTCFHSTPSNLFSGSTAEGNNLTLGACTATGGAAPYIQFTESN
ncbi:hypothetical protein [Rudaea sp. 3F27F6]|uniref:hypothetical protein n=1 Tax=Rudaea sp. 3F27F6 TaxID=2502208 RepID=UPI0010F86A9B|nr:hypothetical protein [Rudaea sp. 3F27F6]